MSDTDKCGKCGKDLGNSRHLMCLACRSNPCKHCGKPTLTTYRVCNAHGTAQSNASRDLRRQRAQINDGPGIARRITDKQRPGDDHGG